MASRKRRQDESTSSSSNSDYGEDFSASSGDDEPSAADPDDSSFQSDSSEERDQAREERKDVSSMRKDERFASEVNDLGVESPNELSFVSSPCHLVHIFFEKEISCRIRSEDKNQISKFS